MIQHWAAQSPTALSKLSEISCPLVDHNAGLGFLHCLPWIWLISFRNATAVNLRKISLCLQGRWNNWMDVSVMPRALSVGSTYRGCNPEPEKTSSTLLIFLPWKRLTCDIYYTHSKTCPDWSIFTQDRVNKWWIPSLQTRAVPRRGRKRKVDSDR